MNKKQNILLTGASGTVGYEILKKLFELKNEFNITVFNIKSKKTVKKFQRFSKEIEIIYGDISNNEEVKKISFNKDIVIHLAAILPPLADEIPELAYKINTIGTKNIIKNLEENSPNAFFIYSSSISVYGDRLKNPYISINDPIVPSQGDEYAKTKIDAEKHIISSKLNWCILRLTAIMGKHKLSKLLFHMPLNTLLEIATPQNTATAFINSLYKTELLKNKLFNLGGGEKYRIKYIDFLKNSFKIIGLGKLNFPKKAFAEKNFHCGYYSDGHNLEKILNFQKGTIEEYFKDLEKNTSCFKKFWTLIFRGVIKSILLKQSEPYIAYKTNDIQMKERFFN